MPDKFNLVQEEIARGGSYQQEILKLLCEIVENLENINKSKTEIGFVPTQEEVKEIYTETIISKPKRKRGRPPKRR